jgi:hypothetical protein
MILQAADDVGVRESARELGVWPKTVRYWRGRGRQGDRTIIRPLWREAAARGRRDFSYLREAEQRSASRRQKRFIHD